MFEHLFFPIILVLKDYTTFILVFEQILKVLFNQKSTIVNKIYVTILRAFQQLKGMYHKLNHCSMYCTWTAPYL
jgi:hypothetical protein